MNGLTESRSITGFTIFNAATERRSTVRNSTYRDAVTVQAKMAVGEEAAGHLGLGRGEFWTESVSVMAMDFNEAGDIVVHWLARFNCIPTKVGS